MKKLPKLACFLPSNKTVIVAKSEAGKLQISTNSDPYGLAEMVGVSFFCQNMFEVQVFIFATSCTDYITVLPIVIGKTSR